MYFDLYTALYEAETKSEGSYGDVESRAHKTEGMSICKLSLLLVKEGVRVTQLFV